MNNIVSMFDNVQKKTYNSVTSQNTVWHTFQAIDMYCTLNKQFNFSFVICCIFQRLESKRFGNGAVEDVDTSWRTVSPVTGQFVRESLLISRKSAF